MDHGETSLNHKRNVQENDPHSQQDEQGEETFLYQIQHRIVP